MPQMVFKDRTDAGKKLAERLEKYKSSETIVLGIPRGGVPVAYEIAKELNAPLGIVTPRKLGVPGNPEYAMGAIAPNGIRILNQNAVNSLDITKEEIKKVEKEERKKLNRRLKKYKNPISEKDITGKTVIIVDDGLATGLTARATVEYVKKQKPKKVVLAVPVGAYDSISKISSYVNELVFVQNPYHFTAVGNWYQDFSPTTDEEVLNILDKYK